MRKISPLTKILYLFFVSLLFYLLLISRSGEVYTVWQHLHPSFVPLFFLTTTLLGAIILLPGKLNQKLLLIIVYSIFCHSLFVIVFPAGNLDFQQNVLGITRRIFDSISPHGYRGTHENILTRIYNWFDGGGNFQSAYSVVFARMFGVDVFWSHLLLGPILWGVFVPIVTFKITGILGGNERISSLSSLLGSAFPLLVYMGSISVPNGLGYIFFLGTLFFSMKYLASPETKYTQPMLIFAFASFLSHFLTGFISLSLLLLAFSLKSYRTETGSSSFAKLSLFFSFVLATSILPCVLIFQRIFVPMYTSFTMERIYEYTTTELIGEFLLGEYSQYSPYAIPIFVAGPLIALVWIVYTLYETRNHKLSDGTRCYTLYLFLGLLMLWIDYRILKIFMIDVPFNEERLWIFRDLLSVPLVALAIEEFSIFVRPLGKYSKVIAKSLKDSLHARAFFRRICLRFVWIPKLLHTQKHGFFLLFNLSLLALLAGWITSSVYYAYPHYSLLQTTSYELEAVKYIDETTNKNYIVISDRCISYAGQMIVGVQNPRAYYFPDYDSRAVALFTKMKNNPSNEVLIEAMNYTEAEVAYFIMTKPRLGEEEYNRIIQQAQQNNLPTYKVFYYEGEEKLRIFHHELT